MIIRLNNGTTVAHPAMLRITMNVPCDVLRVRNADGDIVAVYKLQDVDSAEFVPQRHVDDGDSNES